MNPSNGIAVGYTQIVNANLYLASWVSFGCVVFIVGDLMGDLFTGQEGSAVGLSRLDYQRFWKTRRGKWFALTAITGIALSASVRTFQAFDCKQAAMNSNNTCIDTKLAISMTVLAGIISLVMVGIGRVGGIMAVHFEKVLAVSATIVWTIGLVVITFGEGPVRYSISKKHGSLHRSYLLVSYFRALLSFLSAFLFRFSVSLFLRQSIGPFFGKSILCDVGRIYYQCPDYSGLLSQFDHTTCGGGNGRGE
jgi:hypothetical protein